MREFKLKRTRDRIILGQAIKGAGRMPWHQEPTKDVVNCDKPWEVVSKRYYPWISEWGNPAVEETVNVY